MSLPLATLPSKQGLKHGSAERAKGATAWCMPLATLPSKQGLKPTSMVLSADEWSDNMPLATLPSKQGLKQNRIARAQHQRGAQTSCYTSIKTRIETSSYRARPSVFQSGSSCYTSIKTRIETGNSKFYGLDVFVFMCLLLHFHQNKD